jgi:carboxypeptidase PM20D1
MKKALIIFALLCVGLLSVLLVNTFRFTSKQIQVEPIKTVTIDESGATGRLAQSLRFKTVSHENARGANYEELLAFHHYLQQSFPRVHSTLDREVIGAVLQK